MELRDEAKNAWRLLTKELYASAKAEGLLPKLDPLAPNAAAVEEFYRGLERYHSGITAGELLRGVGDRLTTLVRDGDWAFPGTEDELLSKLDELDG